MTVTSWLILPDLGAVERGLVRIDGDPARVAELFALLDDFSLMFEVVEPKREPRAAPARPGS